MAQIDNLIAMMVQRKVERALLVNDKPMYLFLNGQQTTGSIIPGAQLQGAVQEITPADLRSHLTQDGHFDFPYQSPHGLFDIGVERSAGSLQITISPTTSDKTGFSLAPSGMDGATSSGPPETGAAPANGHADGKVTVRESKRRIGHMDEMFRMMQDVEASDLHLSSDEHPMLRIHGIMKKLEDFEINDAERLKQLLYQVTPKRNQDQWEEIKDSDFAYELEGVARFRCNIFADRKGIGGVFRLIPSEVLTVEQLHLPRAMVELCYLSKGLVVVTGPTGSGKSTTLAALVDHVNKHRTDHIITIEDPIEFVHNNKRCLINQREVHVHTSGFKRALVAALREDPDIVLVGEMRDLETIAIAIETAETGHLVFGTLHTTTAPSTVDRIIDQFPADQQAQIRVMLSESLKGVIAQTLLRTVDGKRIAAHEILLVPSAVSNLIREGKTFQLPSQMQIGKGQGMLLMTDSIVEHVKSGRVHPHEGYVKAVDKVGILQAYEAHDIDYNLSEQG